MQESYAISRPEGHQGTSAPMDGPTVPRVIEAAVGLEKFLDDVLALLNAGNLPECIAPRPTREDPELPDSLVDGLQRVSDSLTECGNKVRVIRDLVQRLRARIM